jgi:hypothetical protein
MLDSRLIRNLFLKPIGELKIEKQPTWESRDFIKRGLF